MERGKICGRRGRSSKNKRLFFEEKEPGFRGEETVISSVGRSG